MEINLLKIILQVRLIGIYKTELVYFAKKKLEKMINYVKKVGCHGNVKNRGHTI